jgi:hypothetical protein
VELEAAELAPYLFGVPAMLLLIAGTTHLLTLPRLRTALAAQAVLPPRLIPPVPIALALAEVLLGVGGLSALFGESVVLRRTVGAATLVLGSVFLLYLLLARRRAAPQQPCGCLPLPTRLGSRLVFLPAGAVVLLSMAALAQTLVEETIERQATMVLQALVLAILLVLLPAADARAVAEVDA